MSNSPQSSGKPLPRIGVRAGEGEIGKFVYEASGEAFNIWGFNHTVLGPPNQHHVVFNIGQYDAEALEEDLAGMKEAGANTVRFWAWGDFSDGTGVVGPMESEGVLPAYMDNFIDFLQLCRKHRIYAIPILDECPMNRKYEAVADEVKLSQPCPEVTGYNKQYLSAPFIAAKAALIRDFVGEVKRREPELLSTVLAWSLCNEAFVMDSEGPFNLKEGLVKSANGKTYDMGDKHQRQACFDEGMAHWANELTAAVKSVDHQAMVTTGMWTSNAQDRESVNYLLEPRVDDRYPPRPSVLAGPGCELDFIDIHIYPFHGGTGINLESCEYDQLKSLGAPVLCGEYGIFRHLTETEEAIQQERQLRGNIQGLGFAGPLLWVWDLIANSNTYTAEELGMR